MKSKIASSDLIEFENQIAKEYENGKIANPIHLSGTGHEEALINIFKEIKKEDWVFSTHRNHYHVLLKSQDQDWVRKQIYKSSMHINSKKHKIFTSAIVGGNLPIALGVALALKLKGKKDKVYCFTGDMASRMGGFTECVMYADGHDLPIKFVIEDNKLGVMTNTGKVWGSSCYQFHLKKPMVAILNYKRKWPHHGIGKWVNF